MGEMVDWDRECRMSRGEGGTSRPRGADVCMHARTPAQIAQTDSDFARLSANSHRNRIAQSSVAARNVAADAMRFVFGAEKQRNTRARDFPNKSGRAPKGRKKASGGKYRLDAEGEKADKAERRSPIRHGATLA